MMKMMTSNADFLQRKERDEFGASVLPSLYVCD